MSITSLKWEAKRPPNDRRMRGKPMRPNKYDITPSCWTCTHGIWPRAQRSPIAAGGLREAIRAAGPAKYQAIPWPQSCRSEIDRSFALCTKSAPADTRIVRKWHGSIPGTLRWPTPATHGNTEDRSYRGTVSKNPYQRVQPRFADRLATWSVPRLAAGAGRECSCRSPAMENKPSPAP